MPRKKSVKSAASRFRIEADSIFDFFQKTSGLKDEYLDWCVDYSIIRLYREFETLMLEALSGAINNDASKTISATVGFNFPKHMSNDVCKYLIVGTGYFDFKGRDGLIKTIKDFVPDNHYLVSILKKSEYKDALERLSALRNFAAHDSERAKIISRKAIGGEKIGSSGSWLRKQNRLSDLLESLKKISDEIESQAPY